MKALDHVFVPDDQVRYVHELNIGTAAAGKRAEAEPFQLRPHNGGGDGGGDGGDELRGRRLR